MTPKTPRSAATLGTLDDFLREEGKLEEFEAVAIKEVLVSQTTDAEEQSLRQARSLNE